MAIGSTLSGGAIDSAINASSASQAAGGTTSQSSAIASTAVSQNDYRHSAENKAAEARNRESSNTINASQNVTVTPLGGEGGSQSYLINSGDSANTSNGVVVGYGGISPQAYATYAARKASSATKTTDAVKWTAEADKSIAIANSNKQQTTTISNKTPVVRTETMFINPEISTALKESGGSYTVKSGYQTTSGNSSASSANMVSPSVLQGSDDISQKAADVANALTPDTIIMGTGLYQNVASSQTRTVTDDLIIADPSSLEKYKSVLESLEHVPVIDNLAKTAETLTINPKTGDFSPVAPFANDIVDARLNEWNEFDGSGADRAIAGMQTSVDVGTTAASFGVGAGIGAGIKAVSFGLGKAVTTKAGSVIIPKITSPLIKGGNSAFSQTASKLSSPINIVANGANAVFIGDTAKTVGEKFVESPKSGFTELAKVAVQLSVAVVGGGAGYKVADTVAGKIQTKGLTYLPTEKFTVEGIPLSYKLNQDNLKVSFETNTFYPKPDKIAETGKRVQDVSSSARLPDHPSQTVTASKQIFHATNRPFGQTFEVAESQSEIKNLFYGAPKAETYFTRISGERKSTPGLFVDIQPSTGGEILNIKGTAVKKIDYELAAKDLGIPMEKLKNSADLQYKAADYYVERYGKEGEFYIPAIKAEYEAGPKAGTKYRRLQSRYYTKVDGVNVRISEYEPVLNDVSITTAKSVKNSRYSVQKASYPEYSGKSQKIPVGYSTLSAKGYSSIAKPSTSSTVPGLSSSELRLSSKYSYSSGLSGSSSGSTNSGSYSSSGGGGSSSGRGGSSSGGGSSARSISEIVYGGSSSSSSVSARNSGFKPMTNFLQQKKKSGQNVRGFDVDYYRAAQRGRIDHLSIVDPLEFMGRGSMTNRNRADMTLYKGKIYLVDNEISIAKPRGRRKRR